MILTRSSLDILAQAEQVNEFKKKKLWAFIVLLVFSLFLIFLAGSSSRTSDLPLDQRGVKSISTLSLIVKKLTKISYCI